MADSVAKALGKVATDSGVAMPPGGMGIREALALGPDVLVIGACQPVAIERDAFTYLSPAETPTQGKEGDKKYFDPTAPEHLEWFAHCGRCSMYTGEVGKEGDVATCTILGADVEVKGEWSCTLYVPGLPAGPSARSGEKGPGKEVAHVTTEQAGLAPMRVSCGRCYYYRHRDSGTKTDGEPAGPPEDGVPEGGYDAQPWGSCGLFRMLTEQFPEAFALPDRVEQFACCDAWSPAIEARTSGVRSP